MIKLKNKKEIEVLREGGAVLSQVLGQVVNQIGPEADTRELDELAEKLIRQAGGRPSFKGYQSDGDERAFTSTMCTCINHEVVHAPAIPGRRVHAGDILKLDIGMWYGGLCTDMAVTVPVGGIDDKLRKLVITTRKSLLIGLEKAIVGNWISDIGKGVDRHVRRNGFSTVKDLVGHGVGYEVHEEPRIPNYFDPSLRPVRIQTGMVLAIEPMVNAGSDEVQLMPDEWTIVTADGQPSAHFEVTLAITENGTEVLTPLPDVGL
ncbi:type I methionyl aminopeptidase [Candidatus Uhrbacteria bacterium RIFOXYC2_FULL_47_19]|uniref:Methionine aminopeptidase n=1 Tax=Candidatus Uhrbacteria bacterium RIFOXYC2_FULL_47_19 TaxID=1802424 RepID=A0A1F7WEK9_9BACT|nr:MAG: type I methionyl aminopeptidase [Candidatus Uhrbacteria bacterium RIFOXYC2_FULL_47_19]HCC22438.1 type I methionyl aminopeptidase [Candidatus Uhrbacteria bacterium]